MFPPFQCHTEYSLCLDNPLCSAYKSLSPPKNRDGIMFSPFRIIQSKWLPGTISDHVHAYYSVPHLLPWRNYDTKAKLLIWDAKNGALPGPDWPVWTHLGWNPPPHSSCLTLKELTIINNIIKDQLPTENILNQNSNCEEFVHVAFLHLTNVAKFLLICQDVSAGDLTCYHHAPCLWKFASLLTHRYKNNTLLSRQAIPI